MKLNTQNGGATIRREPILKIYRDHWLFGGHAWSTFMNACVRDREERFFIDSKMIISASSSKVLHLWASCSKPEINLEFHGVYLHIWEPLLLVLRAMGVHIKGVCIHHGCMSERGAYILGLLLDPQRSGFQVETISFSSLRMASPFVACTHWIRGLSMVPIRDLKLKIAPSWLLPLFVQHGRFQNQPEWRSCSENEELISLSMMMNHSMDNNFCTESMNIELNNATTNLKLQVIGNVLRHARVQALKVVVGFSIRNFSSPQRQQYYDFFRDAIHCREITFQFKGDFIPLFPHATGLVSLIGEKGNLKRLCFHKMTSQNWETFPLPSMVEDAIKFADLTHLDTFEVGPVSNDSACLLELCHRLAQNKGPQCLKMSVLQPYHLNDSNEDDPFGSEYSNVNGLLARSLRGNTKVQKLEVTFLFPCSNLTCFDVFQGCTNLSEITINFAQDSVLGQLPFDDLARLIHGDGKLKRLGIHCGSQFHNDCMSNFVAGVLGRANVANLDKFAIGPISTDSDAFSAICHQIQENRVPPRLEMTICRSYSLSDRNNQALGRLGGVLSDNTRIKQLDFRIIGLITSGMTLLQFVQQVGNMPMLEWFSFHAGTEENHNRYPLEIASRVERHRERHTQVLEHLGNSKALRHVRLPFKDYGLKKRMEVRHLLRSGNDVLEGIWPSALASMKDPSDFFCAVREIPRLFQVNSDDENAGPKFTVPHSHNCPSCSKRNLGSVSH